VFLVYVNMKIVPAVFLAQEERPAVWQEAQEPAVWQEAQELVGLQEAPAGAAVVAAAAALLLAASQPWTASNP
jgi:hypothetical protein